MTAPAPYYRDDAVTLYQGDALRILPTLDATVDAIIADPPYSSGGQYRGDRALSTTQKYVQTDTVAKGTAPVAFTGDNRDQRGHLVWSHLWMSEALRLLAPGGIIGVFSDWRQLPLTTDALQVAGVVWRGIVPWWKPNGRRATGRYANNCEYFIWGTNGPRSRAQDAAGNTLGGFWQENTPRNRVHQTQKPVGLLSWLADIAPAGGLILDPFAGSGSTLLAARETGRRAIGIELSAEHCETAAGRLRGELEAVA
ncbi:DNA-methyltransferase [Nocardia carnea]|uniref:DNA-methyltransferase n=1 Tax=Nocardia carnea TaxID=37328 RepID=UPI002457C4B4|nr:site-specific DNA-methyltransferase [Nocardia carnea]